MHVKPFDFSPLPRLIERILLQGRPIVLIIDETGDRKKGDTTDYVKRQYIGNLGKTDKHQEHLRNASKVCQSGFQIISTQEP